MKLSKGYRDTVAAHRRFMSSPQISSELQARLYATFLLARDGVADGPPNPTSIDVSWTRIRVGKRSQKRFIEYAFKGKRYTFPHWDYVQKEVTHETVE